MAGPYFHRSSWSSFTYNDTIYNLDHLNEYEFSIVDNNKITRRIAVTFSDHCFTRMPETGDDPALAYPDSDRRPVGHFSFNRYYLSRGLVGHIAEVASSSVWIAEGQNFAVVRGADLSGQPVQYGILFSLDRVTGLPVDLHMRIKTAYPLDVDGIMTYGKVSFRLLVTLRMSRKTPRRMGSKRIGRLKTE